MAAKTGNDYARKWNESDAIEAFIEGVNYSEIDEGCRCIEDVIHHLKMPTSTFYDLIKQFNVLESIKRDMHTNIIRRINSGSLDGEFPPAPAIWRLKQMGESDQQNINVTSSGKPLPDWLQDE